MTFQTEELKKEFNTRGWVLDSEGSYRKRLGVNIHKLTISGKLVFKERLVGSTWKIIGTYSVCALFNRTVVLGRHL